MSSMFNLGPQVLGELPGEQNSLVRQKAERVEKENRAIEQEQSGSRFDQPALPSW